MNNHCLRKYADEDI